MRSNQLRNSWLLPGVIVVVGVGPFSKNGRVGVGATKNVEGVGTFLETSVPTWRSFRRRSTTSM